ncbi:MAG: GtrA family protein, partial [Myxococcales bacterium]|nr:GtrA family protein [Myxococcales bacterium]
MKRRSETRQFSRSMFSGLVATLADLAVLTLLVERVGLSTAQANLPALMVGAALQFVGNKWFVFRSGNAPIVRQGILFSLAELATFSLNALLYHLFVSVLPLPYQLTRVVLGAVVYVGFSYPIWRL